MKKVLLVIDYQNDFVSSQGEVAQNLPDFSFEHLENLHTEIQKLIDYFHCSNWPVIFLMSDYSTYYYCGPFREYRVSSAYGNVGRSGEWGHELYKLKKDEEDIVIKKYFFDGFYKTNLKEELDKLGATELVICGTNTDVCVYQTALTASMLGYHVEIPKNTTHTVLKENKETFLKQLQILAGIKSI